MPERGGGLPLRVPTQTSLDLVIDRTVSPLQRAMDYPSFRFMGSKHRLLPWIYEVLSQYKFRTAVDAFSGSGVVAYLLKAMGARVLVNDHMRFPYHVANALVANPGVVLTDRDVETLLKPNPSRDTFIERTFDGIFFTREDLQFLDNVWSNLALLDDPWKRSLAIAAMCRAALKRQPRGVFTVANARSSEYDDGRRDLRLSMEEHFLESISLFREIVFDDGLEHQATRLDVFDVPTGADVVYLDPPYVPRSDDNCYIKRYHFVEGLACYWRGVKIMPNSKVKKIEKVFTPFSYRRTAIDAFDRLFSRFRESTIVLSYSSNGYPDLDVLVSLMQRYKATVRVYEHDHRYHYGTHAHVRKDRALVKEYLIVGTD